jgi:hypothetical protein
MSTDPHAISPSHEGPSPQPSPTRSVKDVLITLCKECHETEHKNGCATKAKKDLALAKRPVMGQSFSLRSVRTDGNGHEYGTEEM